MSDSNLRTNSSIELSDIRKLDILLTQCETSSCENICNDCCAKLGSSLEDDDDSKDRNGSGGSDSLIVGSAAPATVATTKNERAAKLRRQKMVDINLSRTSERNDG